MHARLALKTQLKISPQQVMTSTLLQASALDLEALVRQELTDNPALEQSEAWSALQTQYAASIADHASPRYTPAALLPWSAGDGAPDDLIEQLIDQPTAIEQLNNQAACLVEEADLALVAYLLHSLDEQGYLRTSLAELARTAGVSEATVERVRQRLHELEPPGIGARDLHECLQIQCAHLAALGVECTVVQRILNEAWTEFSAQQWASVARKLHISRRCVEEAQQFIRTNFYPYPLALVSSGAPSSAVFPHADLIIRCQENGNGNVYSIEIPNAIVDRLRINPAFLADFRSESSDGISITAPEQRWLNSRVDQARHFIQALNQRWAILGAIGEYLVDYQAAFLAFGPRYLKRLTQSMVATAIGVHESTISRAVHNKNVLLPTGRLMPLCDFFDHSLPAKAVIHRLLTQTNRRVSDREIADALRVEGIDLARRTITKYRDQMKVVPTHIRN